MADEIRDRVTKYIRGMKERLSKVHVSDEKLHKILDLSRQYTEDAEYYLSKGDENNRFSRRCLRRGAAGFRYDVIWQGPRSDVSKKVFVGGTFDLLHPGHVEFLKEAAKYGRVYVSISRDKNAERVKKRPIVMHEDERLELVKAIRYVYEAFLGHENDFLDSVTRVRPDVIFLGPDQKVDENFLKEELKRRGLNEVQIIRMNERLNAWNHSSSTRIISDVLEKFCKPKSESQM
jgi:cytidyltransferase-related domain